MTTNVTTRANNGLAWPGTAAAKSRPWKTPNSATATRCYLGVGLPRQDCVKDSSVAVVCVNVNVDDRPRCALTTEEVLTVDRLQRCLRHANWTARYEGRTGVTPALAGLEKSRADLVSRILSTQRGPSTRWEKDHHINTKPLSEHARPHELWAYILETS